MRGGVAPAAMLSRLTDEDIVELLATSTDRMYERNLLATEALNRIQRSRHELDHATRLVLHALRGVGEAARRLPRIPQAVPHAAPGGEDLGNGAPFASLDAAVGAAAAAGERLAAYRETILCRVRDSSLASRD